MPSRAVVIPGPVGRLDARVHGQGPPVVVLHPHPLYGGSKATRLVHALCESLAEQGRQAWRFDFRGTGGSEGVYGHGWGEAEDAAAVWDHIRTSTGAAAGVVGFSFGGAVALRLARARAVPWLVLLSAPAHVPDAGLQPVEDIRAVTCPVVLVWGTDDGLVPREDVEALQSAHPDLDLRVLAGADHFLTPTHHARAVAAVRAAVEGLHK